MSRVAYLAHPIDQDNGGEAKAGVAFATRALLSAGYNVYDPSGWVGCGDGDPRIEMLNQQALGMADLVVAVLPAGIPTIGTPMEIADALHLGKPVIVLSDVEVSYALKRPGIYWAKSIGDLEIFLALEEILVRANDTSVEPIRVVLTPNTDLPRRAYPDDAGVDLTLAQDYMIEPGHFIDAHTTVEAVQLPNGYWGMIIGRSSTLRKHRLHVPQAVIDPGWRGPLYVGVWNLGLNPVKVLAGDRIGQLILIPNHPVSLVAVDQVAPAPRGTNGFGSTG